VRRQFLVSYGSDPEIICCSCRKRTRMVPALHGEVTDQDKARYRRIHACGPLGGPWDLEQGGRESFGKKPRGDLAPRFRAVTRWDAHEGWTVRVMDANGFEMGTAVTSHLREVESTARRLLPRAGRVRADLRVDLQLHPEVEPVQQLTGDLVDDDGVIVDRIVSALRSDRRMPSEDIVVVLETLYEGTEPGPRFVTNSDVVRGALDDLPDVVAVRWSDHRHSAARVSCRRCLDADRRPWISHPHGVSILLYGSVCCDGCSQHIARRGVR
jgi:hypothetical protein